MPILHHTCIVIHCIKKEHTHHLLIASLLVVCNRYIRCTYANPTILIPVFIQHRNDQCAHGDVMRGQCEGERERNGGANCQSTKVILEFLLFFMYRLERGQNTDTCTHAHTCGHTHITHTHIHT